MHKEQSCLPFFFFGGSWKPPRVKKAQPLWASCCSAWLSSWGRSVSLSPAKNSLALAYTCCHSPSHQILPGCCHVPWSCVCSRMNQLLLTGQCSSPTNPMASWASLVCYCLSPLGPQTGHSAWMRLNGPKLRGSLLQSDICPAELTD